MAPGVALQRAVVSALRDNFDLSILMGGEVRVYDRVPAAYKLPYITIGDVQIIDDSHCEAAWECFVTSHVWSEAVGKPQAQEIADAIAPLLNAELAIEGFVCVDWQFRDARTFTEPDGLTTHAVVSHRYLIDAA